ncbi:MAG: glucokinase [Legionella sp.]|nr:glucokinase [Legionella sp.]
MSKAVYAIVADIGGTNARFSRVNLTDFAVDKVAVYPCARFQNLVEALRAYQVFEALLSIKRVVIAIASPITGDEVVMTNLHWKFSIQDVKKQLDLVEFQVLNDFTAIAMSLPLLRAKDKVQIGSGTADPKKPMVVLGAGTGLGVAHLVPTALSNSHKTAKFLPIAGEGGHVTWAPQTEQEIFIQRFLNAHYGHVSWERLLSGPGIERIYLALAAYCEKQVIPSTAEEITQQAISGSCEIALATLEQFFTSLGSFAGDLALALGALGGVYIAGGIVPKLLARMETSSFRRCFEAKGRASLYLRGIGTFVILAEHPGLIGAAAYLRESMQTEAVCLASAS